MRLNMEILVVDWFGVGVGRMGEGGVFVVREMW